MKIDNVQELSQLLRAEGYSDKQIGEAWDILLFNQECGTLSIKYQLLSAWLKDDWELLAPYFLQLVIKHLRQLDWIIEYFSFSDTPCSQYCAYVVGVHKQHLAWGSRVFAVLGTREGLLKCRKSKIYCLFKELT